MEKGRAAERETTGPDPPEIFGRVSAAHLAHLDSNPQGLYEFTDEFPKIHPSLGDVEKGGFLPIKKGLYFDELHGEAKGLDEALADLPGLMLPSEVREVVFPFLYGRRPFDLGWDVPARQIHGYGVGDDLAHRLALFRHEDDIIPLVDPVMSAGKVDWGPSGPHLHSDEEDPFPWGGFIPVGKGC